MKRVLATILLLPFASAAYAGPYGDDLSRCLVGSTTSEDKSLLVRWIFHALALNPTVAPMTEIPADKREEVDRKTAGLFEKLLTETCLTETQLAVKYEGSATVGESFKLLGQVAATEIFSDPAVAKGTEKFTTYIDAERMEKLFGATE